MTALAAGPGQVRTRGAEAANDAAQVRSFRLRFLDVRCDTREVVLRTPVVTLSLAALFSLVPAGCAKATLEDRGRGEDEDAGLGAKPELPDARPPVEPVDAASRVDAGPGGADAGCTVEPIDLLVNGNFDEGAGFGWTESSSGGFALVVADGDPSLPPELAVTADSPTFMSYLGGYPNGIDFVQQDLRIPTGASGLTLTGKARIETEETVDLEFDHTFLEIADTEGTVLETLADFSNDDDTGAQYITFTIPVAGDYADQTIRFQLHGTSDATLDTHFFFDTLVLSGTGCAAELAPAP